MKRIIAAVTGLSFLALTACHNNDATLAAQQRMIDSMNTELAKKRVIDSMNEVVKTQYVMTPAPPPVATSTTTTTTTAPAAATTSRAVHHTYSGRSSRAPRTRTVTRERVVYQEAPKKKGWSAKAKGAVIGTAAGAAAGAIINGRNRGAGAVIGGVLGAGAGTGVGAIIDKKQGR